MKVVGITGGAGSGKSYVCHLLAQNFGYPVIDSDSVAKSLMHAGSPILSKIAAMFGAEYLKEDGTLDRVKMAKLVFSNEQALKKLNGLVHPATIQKIRELLDAYERDGCVVAVVESAIADKAEYRNFCDELWHVTASQNTRKERLAARGYSRERISQVMQSQSDPVQFASVCQRTIYNEKDTDDAQLLCQLKHLFHEMDSNLSL